MKKEPKKIFSGDYSRDMWEKINSAKSKDDLRTALYFVCCRLQEFESRLTKRELDGPKCTECLGIKGTHSDTCLNNPANAPRK